MLISNIRTETMCNIYIKYTTCEYLTLELKQCVVLYKVYYMWISNIRTETMCILYKVYYMWISNIRAETMCSII